MIYLVLLTQLISWLHRAQSPWPVEESGRLLKMSTYKMLHASATVHCRSHIIYDKVFTFYNLFSINKCILTAMLYYKYYL